MTLHMVSDDYFLYIGGRVVILFKRSSGPAMSIDVCLLGQSGFP